MTAQVEVQDDRSRSKSRVFRRKEIQSEARLFKPLLTTSISAFVASGGGLRLRLATGVNRCEPLKQPGKRRLLEEGSYRSRSPKPVPSQGFVASTLGCSLGASAARGHSVGASLGSLGSQKAVTKSAELGFSLFLLRPILPLLIRSCPR